MRAVLTGSTGFLGSHLKKYLSSQKWEIQEITRRDSLDGMVQKMSTFKPDVVMHLATYFIAEHTQADLEKLIDANLLFGLKILQAMQTSSCRNLINTGTNWQNWQGKYGTPASLYAATKTSFEELIRYFVSGENFHVYNLKLCDTYGPEDRRGKLISKLIQMAKAHQQVEFSPGEQLLDLTHEADVVRAFEQAAKLLLEEKSDEGFMKGFSVSSGERKSLKAVIHLVEELSQSKISSGFGSRPYRRREVMEPQELDPRLPGWKAEISLREGLQELLNER